MKTNFYIDGLNLYYLALKGTPDKWLDLAKLCQRLLPNHELNRIRYFTSLVYQWPNNLEARQRQQVYIRAVNTIPNLTVHYGQFLLRTKKGALVTTIPQAPGVVEIKTPEEKRTDVNLATYLLMDGFDRDYEQAVVISNDSDLALPIEMVRDKLGFPVLVVNPNKSTNFSGGGTPTQLINAATFTRRLRPSTPRNCQFPYQMRDDIGTITKPDGW